MKKKNILYVVFALMSGGVEQMLLNYLSDKRFSDYNLFVAYYGVGDDRCIEEFKRIGVNLINLKNRSSNIFKCYLEIKKILIDFKIDIIHSNMNIENYISMKAAYDVGVPLRISHSHGLPYPSNNFLKKVVRRIKILIGKRYSNCYLACSKKAGDYLFGVNNYKIIYNAIDYSKFQFNNDVRKKMRRLLGIDKYVLIGYFGRFNKGKNHEFLIDLFSKIDLDGNKIKVVFIGAGPLLDSIKEKISFFNMTDSFIILDPKDNIYDYYQALDLFVFPSVEEGLGMVAIESQINNLYCVCSKGVPLDTKISNNICFHNLDIDEWLNCIKNHLSIRNANCNNNSLFSNNYDITIQRDYLHSLYEEEFMKCIH